MSNEIELNENIDLLRRGINQIRAIQETLQNEDSEDVLKHKELDEIISSTGCIASDIYNFSKEEVSLPVMVVINRFRSSDHLPEFPDFWKNIDAIEDLYTVLKKDGYRKYIEISKEDNNGST